MASTQATNDTAFGKEGGNVRHRKSAVPPSIAEEDVPSPGPKRSQTSPLLGTPPGRVPRRTSSFMTDSSVETGVSVRSSTDDLFVPRASGKAEELHQDPSLWHSLPLVFAILPAIGGVAFKKGNVWITDLALLIVAAIYLNWCLVTPWVWYHSAQSVKVAEPTIYGSALDDLSQDDIHEAEEEPSPTVEEQPSEKKPHSDKRQQAVQQELHQHEFFALAFCFVGPLIGAYVLHLIRAQMSHFGHELISNLHLSLFVLGAELRPLRHSLKMVQARTLHLQRFVREDPHVRDDMDAKALTELRDRLGSIESSVSDSAAQNISAANAKNSQNAEMLKKTNSAMQSQIDALNRAVRRYEKRATAQTIQTEARLQDLEHRLRDALSLAAAAANSSQQPSTLSQGIHGVSKIVFFPLHAAWSAAAYSMHIISSSFTNLFTSLGLARASHPKRLPPKHINSSTKFPKDRASLRPVKPF